MVDRNGDGLDDNTGRPVRRTPRTTVTETKTSSQEQPPQVKKTTEPQGINAAWNWLGNVNNNIAAGARNGVGNIAGFFASKPYEDNFEKFRQEGIRDIGLYDIFAPKPGGTRNRTGGGSFGPPVENTPTSTAPVAPSKTLADYLQEATSLIGGSGGGVNYDPQRATARANASEADARLEAMYRQLRGSIDADAPVLQQAYQTAIDATAQNAATAQVQTQAASDNAQARNDQVLANLGIQQAAGNQIQEGRDLGTQTAGNIAAQASKGQAAGDRLVSNQATALQHNTNIGNAAGLEGNLQRAANQAKLNALLAEIDQKEQQDNAALSENSFSKQLSLANSLLDFDRYNQEQQASQDQNLAQLMNDRDIAAMKAQSNQAPDLRAMLKMMGVDETWLTKDPKAAASLISALTKTTFAQ